MVRPLALLFGLAAFAPSAASAQDKKDDFRIPTKEWAGVIKDAKLKAVAKPGQVITDAETFEKVWKAWQPKAESPEIDFATQVVVVSTSEYEPLKMSLYNGPDKWKASNSNKSPKAVTGFGWIIGAFDRKGIKEINGVKLGEAAKDK